MNELLLNTPSNRGVGGLGPETLMAGDNTYGYYGRFTDTALTGVSLAGLVGYTEGVLANDTTEWFKFAYQNKILITPVKPVRFGVTWSGLYNKGLVYGIDNVGLYPTATPTNQRRVVTIRGSDYLVRLFKGADSDPAPTTQYNTTNPAGSLNSEYTLLFKQIYTGGNGSWENLTDADLGNKNSTATVITWCQEKHNHFTDGTGRVTRGYGGILGFGTSPYTLNENDSSYAMGWRPVLELTA